MNLKNLLEKESVKKVNNFLIKNKQDTKLIVLENTARTSQDAANSLNVELGSIVKTLIFNSSLNDEYYVCLVSGDKYISIHKLNTLISNKIKKASAKEVKENTGFSIGGVAPIAFLHPPTLIIVDYNLNRFDKIFAAAGHPHVVFETTFAKLVKMIPCKVVDIVE